MTNDKPVRVRDVPLARQALMTKVLMPQSFSFTAEDAEGRRGKGLSSLVVGD
jgi:hypothetical protein